MNLLFFLRFKLTFDQHTPVEPFGDAGDYDVSEKHIVYTTKDPELPEAWHTKQNVRSSFLILKPAHQLIRTLNHTGLHCRPHRELKAA
jgi:hypothetical protein